MHYIDIDKARKEMEGRGLDVLIAASVINVCYCTGHFSKLWQSLRDHLRLAVIPRDSTPFVTSPDLEATSFAKSGAFEVFEYPVDVYVNYGTEQDLYLKAEENVKDIPQLHNLNVRDLLAKSPVLLAAKILKSRGLHRPKIGIDKEYIETAFFEEIAQALPDSEIVDATQLFLDMRAIKSDEEIQYMVEAISITEEAIKASMPLIKEGGRLLDLHRHYSLALTEKEGSEIGHILLSVSPLPVGEVFSPMKDRFRAGQVLKIDVGAKSNNYSADFARQWTFGEIPQKERGIFNKLLEAVDAMVDKLRPEVMISDIYWAGNNIMREIDPNYGRRLFMGHSIGLEDHERPYITPYTEDILKPGMVMCIEVPYYKARGYGFNLEDEYLITEDGHKLLTSRISRDMPQV